jgi:Protein of unknown function (DUF1572)
LRLPRGNVNTFLEKKYCAAAGLVNLENRSEENVRTARTSCGWCFQGNSGDNETMSDFRVLYIDEAFRSLRGHKRLADGAIAQLDDEQFFAAPDPESNSVAIIVKHLAGNMRSRFTDFLTSDGEKPDRNRDSEFLTGNNAKREELISSWEQNWQLVFEMLNSLQPGDLERTVTIRGEPHSVLQAINRQVTHYAYHVGQIVFLAKHWKGAEWKTLSVPKGQSEQYNPKMASMQKGR